MKEELPATSGQLAKAGFQDVARASQLLAGLEASVGQFLIEELEKVADPDKALLHFVRLFESNPENLNKLIVNKEFRSRLFVVLGASVGLAEHLIRHPESLSILTKGFAINESLEGEGLNQLFTSVASRAELVKANKQALLAIAAKDLASQWSFSQVAYELSLVADRVVETALKLVIQEIPKAKLCQFAVIAMGKAGGRELNYVSDVDVIFVAEPSAGVEEVEAVSVANQIASELINLISSVDQAGEIWQLDAALRPEGKAGALVRTISQHVAYYQQWAQTWEFQALLKARHMAGEKTVSDQYLSAIIHMVWVSSERENFVADVQKMRKRVEQTIDTKVGERELKLSSGGLRDVEFAVQLLQLVHGRSDSQVRSANTLQALAQLASNGYVGREDAATFSACYEFLRNLEHRIQLQQLKRTHVLPEKESELRALGRSLEFFIESEKELDKEWRKNQREVRRIHEKLFYRPLLNSIVKIDAASARLKPEAVRERLEALGYVDPDSAVRHLQALTSGVSRRAQIQKTLLPILLDWFARSPEPDQALLAFRQLSDQLGSTPWYLRLLRDESSAAERLSHVLGASRYATDLLFRAPDAIGMFADDEELQPRSQEQFLIEQNSIFNRYENPEDIVLAARALRRRELLRCATGDISGLMQVEEVGAYLSLVNRTVIEISLTAAILKFEKENNKKINTDLCLIAMGRFGGLELGYGSDADVMFIHRPHPGAQADEAERAALEVANQLRSLLMAPSVDPVLEIDADLRPEGKNGPLVRSLDSYLAYYQTWSSPWEAQALLRAIPIAGDKSIGDQFIQTIDNLRYPKDGLAKDHLVEMRRLKARMESERLPRGADPTLNLKLGRGGLSDVEWTAQLLQMQNAAKHPTLKTTSTLVALKNLNEEKVLSDVDFEILCTAWRRAAQIRNGLMLARNKPTDQIPTAVNDLRALSFVLGENSYADLLEDYRRTTRRARKVMEQVFYGEN
ncbi:MAG: bifunctional [glutamine synthetase] adenylyltransferase/[glutamine synthetase]-adenylyl-L-tyrosine phosphorylase [Candidatus Nanopelagicales bacterium]